MYCFCNKIKTFLNLSEKINTPASVSRRGAGRGELSTGFGCEKDHVPALGPAGSASQGLVGRPGWSPGGRPSSPESHGSSRKETRLMISIFIFENGLERGVGGRILGTWLPAGKRSWDPPCRPQAGFLALGAIGQSPRLFGESLDPLPSQTISTCGNCVFGLA